MVLCSARAAEVEQLKRQTGAATAATRTGAGRGASQRRRAAAAVLPLRLRLAAVLCARRRLPCACLRLSTHLIG